MKSLSIGASGMLAQQLNVEVISNNIANMTTTGFKRQRAEFQDLLYQNQRRVGSTSSDTGTIVPSGIQIGLGVKTAAVYRVTDQGSLTKTDNKFDLAINGGGFFQIELPSGQMAYTRAGSFQLSPEGTLVTQDGFTVMPGITIPADAREVTINDSGEILVTLDGEAEEANVGQLEISIFANDAGLEAIGDNMFLETAASGGPIPGVPATVGYGSMMQGFLESSNVNVVSEITSLITAQRAYEMNSKVIQTTDEMMSSTSQIS